jgi:hypothetical protein
MQPDLVSPQIEAHLLGYYCDFDLPPSESYASPAVPPKNGVHYILAGFKSLIISKLVVEGPRYGDRVSRSRKSSVICPTNKIDSQVRKNVSR